MALPHDYRMAVLMVDIQGFSYQEVAESLEIPMGTLMSRLYGGEKSWSWPCSNTDAPITT